MYLISLSSRERLSCAADARTDAPWYFQTNFTNARSSTKLKAAGMDLIVESSEKFNGQCDTIKSLTIDALFVSHLTLFPFRNRMCTGKNWTQFYFHILHFMSMCIM
eukprot:1127702_1